MTEILTEGPADAERHLLLAHGAGAPMTSPFLQAVTRLLTDRGLRVSRFEFPYMAARREDGGKRRPPPRAENLVDAYVEAVAIVRASLPARQKLLIGGKSMGGRVASLVADTLFEEGRIGGLVCLGYPFHPPGKPETLRTAHLETLKCPTLIVQGERDPFGTRAEVEAYKLSPSIRFAWAADGDHDLGPRLGPTSRLGPRLGSRGASGFTRAGNLAAAADAVATFALQPAPPNRKGPARQRRAI
jgi:predicted alpha/beta-hydrolase family hydrolase